MRRLTSAAVYIGNAGDGRNVRLLMEERIEAIVDLADNEAPITSPREMIYCRIPMADGDGTDLSVVRLAIATLEELIRQEIPTLVCCSAGMSRSPAIVAAALSRVTTRPPQDCLNELAAMGPIDVSPGLWKRVIEAIEQHIAESGGRDTE